MIHFEAVHGGVFGDDRLKQEPKRRDVPLAVAQGIEQAAQGVLRIDLKYFVEGSTGRQNSEVFVQNQERLVDRIDDRLSKSLGVFNVG